MTPNLNVNIPGSSPTTPPAAGLFAGAGGPNANTLGALVSQHRLLELSRFGLRGYDLAQHMLSQQGAVSKLLGEFGRFIEIIYMLDYDHSVDGPVDVQISLEIYTITTQIYKYNFHPCFTSANSTFGQILSEFKSRTRVNAERERFFQRIIH